MICWKRNLVFIWLSQFLSMAGFSFAIPFGPYYIQQLGVTDPLELKLWLAAFAAGAPVSLAIFGPIWGWVADRHGRRLMLLRANLGAALLLLLMGRADSVLTLVLLRCCQGMLTGTMTAAQTLVASHTPHERSGFALGALSSGVFSGAMAGIALGGIFADRFGCRNAFFMAAGLLVLASLLVLFGTNEEFERLAPTGGNANQRIQRGMKTLSPIFPLLLPIAVTALLRRFDGAYIALLVQEIHGSVEGAATRMGGLGAVSSAAGFLAGFVFGHLGDRLSSATLIKRAAFVAGLLMIPHMFVHDLTTLYLLRFGMAFCLGGIEPLFQSMLARKSPPGERGFIFGWAATMRAAGWGLAPLLSGLVATLFNVRAIFLVGGILLILFALAVPRFLRE